MASTTNRRHMAPRAATDNARWSRVSGGRNIRRKPPEPSAMEKAMSMLPFGKKAPAPAKRGRAGKAGTAAMVTAAAGFAFKNRDTIMRMLRKPKQQSGRRSV